MSATDELRRLLDERGVKHSDYDGITEWCGRLGAVCRGFQRYSDNHLDVVIVMTDSESAVNATLGSGTLYDENGGHSDAAYEAVRKESNARARKSAIDKWNGRIGGSDNTVKFDVSAFELGTEKEAALKPLEEAAEVYAEWQEYQYARGFGINGLNEIRLDRLADEIADCIQACVNLAERYGVDINEAMGRCLERNRERGRC